MPGSLAVTLRNPRLYLAVFLGAACGVVVQSYWLVDLLPPNSRQILFYTTIISLAATAAYFWLLERCIEPLLPRLGPRSRLGLIAGSILIGAYLSFAYLNAPGSPPRYVTFLLPREALRISVASKAEAAQVQIQGFKTSLGDVSYNTLDYEGWSRSAYTLRLTNPTNNSLQWSGLAGDKAVITFSAASPQDEIEAAWNGLAESLPAPSSADGKLQFAHTFAVPIYASRWMLLLLGALDFIAVCVAANLVIWQHRTFILTELERSIAGLLHWPGGDGTLTRAENSSGRSVTRSEWLLIVGLIGISLGLRIFKLGSLYPYNDEYSHLLAAKELLQGAPLASVFSRSLLTVTLPVVISQYLFGIELWAARLPGAIFNSLAILPLYLISRKINKPVAILAGLLYAASPWIIALGRDIREHGYYPFYFYGIAYCMVLYLERIPDKLVILRDWRRLLFRPVVRFPLIVLLLVPIYAVFLDSRSAFKIIMLAYPVFGLFLLGKSDLRNRTNILLFAVVGAFLAIAAAAYAAEFGHNGFALTPRFHSDGVALFFPNPIQQWYFNRIPIVPVLAMLAGLVLSIWTIRFMYVPAFVAVLLLTYTLFFSLFFSSIMPRYLLIVQLWYIILFALGLYGLFALLALARKQETLLSLVATGMFALTFNLSQSLVPSLYDKQGNMPITGEYHYNLGPANELLSGRMQPDDVLISNFYGGYVRWIGTPSFRRIFPYGSVTYILQYKGIFPYEAAEAVAEDSNEYILSIVEDNSSGWIVLDSITYSATSVKPLPLKTTELDDKEIEYVGYFGGEYIWRWQPTAASP